MTVEYSCQVVSSDPEPGPTRRRSCSSRMSTRQDRSKKVCWSIVVPDRWHPKISTTWRSSGRARTIERAERLTNARALRLNRGSPSRFLWRDGSSLGDAWATSEAPSMPGNMPSAAKGRAPDRDAAPQGCRYRLHDDPPVRRGAPTATQTADLTRMTHRDRVRPEDLGGRPESPRGARRRPHTRRRRPIRCRGPSCPSRFRPTPRRPLLRWCLPPSPWPHGPCRPCARRIAT